MQTNFVFAQNLGDRSTQLTNFLSSLYVFFWNTCDNLHIKRVHIKESMYLHVFGDCIKRRRLAYYVGEGTNRRQVLGKPFFYMDEFRARFKKKYSEFIPLLKSKVLRCSQYDLQQIRFRDPLGKLDRDFIKYYTYKNPYKSDMSALNWRIRNLSYKNTRNYWQKKPCLKALACWKIKKLNFYQSLYLQTYNHSDRGLVFRYKIPNDPQIRYHTKSVLESIPECPNVISYNKSLDSGIVLMYDKTQCSDRSVLENMNIVEYSNAGPYNESLNYPFLGENTISLDYDRAVSGSWCDYFTRDLNNLSIQLEHARLYAIKIKPSGGDELIYPHLEYLYTLSHYSDMTQNLSLQVLSLGFL